MTILFVVCKNNRIKNIPLNSLFDQIEKEYNIEILIAAHPSALYRGHEFGGRPNQYWLLFNEQKGLRIY